MLIFMILTITEMIYGLHAMEEFFTLIIREIVFIKKCMISGTDFWGFGLVF